MRTNRSRGKRCFPAGPGGEARKKPTADLQGRAAEDQPAGLGLAANAPQEGDQSAQAVPQHEDGFAFGPSDDAVEEHVEIVEYSSKERIEHRGPSDLPCPRRSVAETGTAAGQGLGRRRVAAAMLDKAVDQHHLGPRFAAGLPATLEQSQAVAGRKKSSSKGGLVDF